MNQTTPMNTLEIIDRDTLVVRGDDGAELGRVRRRETVTVRDADGNVLTQADVTDFTPGHPDPRGENLESVAITVWPRTQQAVNVIDPLLQNNDVLLVQIETVDGFVLNLYVPERRWGLQGYPWPVQRYRLVKNQ